MGMKGISTIIAAVLLVAVAVAVGVMVSSWVTQWVTTQTSAASSCVISTRYDIDSAKFTSSDSNLTVFVTNLGATKLYGFAVQVQNATTVALFNSTSPDIIMRPLINSSKRLGQQESAVIIVNMDGATGNYTNLGSSADKIRVLNEACPSVAAETIKITKE